jgi:Cell wall-associated hydrolases (invasion-associated proteins)
MLDPLDWARAHIEVPFKEHGRDRRGWDCWGLVYCAYLDLFDLRLPSYVDVYAGTSLRHRETLATAIEVGRRAWRPVRHYEPGDVAVLYRGGEPMHVGIVCHVEARRSLLCHAEHGAGTVIDPVSRDDPQVEGVYRYAG